MALRFCDSFDHYTTISNKWSSSAGTTLTTGRFGTGFLSRASNTEWVEKALDSRQEWWVGFAFTLGGITGGHHILAVRDTGSNQMGVQMQSGSTGLLQVHRSGTVLATGTTPLAVGVYYYIEFYVKIDNSAGAYELRINGVTELTGSSVDTQNTANATANQIRFGKDVSSAVNVIYDDIYIVDSSGSAPTNTFLGDVRVEALFPNGNGNSSVLVGSDGNSTDNYLHVDEAAPNGDTDYVQGSSVGDKDTYAFTNPTPASGTVYGVQILPNARKTDAGSRSIATVARLSGTEVDGSDQALSTSYAYYPDIRETKPGGGAWSLTDVSNAEFGVKVTV